MVPESRLLAYLHDSTLEQMSWSIDDSGMQVLAIDVICHPEAGYPAWNGKRVSIRSQELIMCSIYAFGYVSGEDTVDEITLDVSQSFMSREADLIERGVGKSSWRMRIRLHSGTEIELSCKDVDIIIHEIGQCGGAKCNRPDGEDQGD